MGVMVSGMVAAMRSVMVTFLVLLSAIYVLGLCFRQVTFDTELGTLYFPTVSMSMSRILIDGLFPDLRGIVDEISSQSMLCAFFFVFCALTITLTVMNLLIG